MAAEDGTSDPTTIIDMELALPPAFLWPECCIYKIPRELRMLNEKAYSPRLISIGPLHHGKRGLKKRDMLKLRYFRTFFYRTQKRQEDFYKLIDNQFHRVLRSYSEFDLAPEDLLKVILLDAIFIIELFLNTARNLDDDEILSTPWLRHAIRVDLMLLENQIPYFVLRELYEYAFMDDNRNEEQHDTRSFLNLTYAYFSLSHEQGHMEEEGDPKHFTDLLRTFHCRPFLSKTIPATRDPDEREIRMVVMPIKHLYSATKLDEAGVKFKAVEGKVSFLDIKFQKNSCLDFCPCFNSSWLLNCLPCLKDLIPCMVRMQTFLEVPHLVVEDRTETLFRNIMALEECHYPREAYFCNYVILLDFLISNEKDVELLVDKKVIRNQLGSNAEVATLINNLCPDQIGDASSIYYDLSRRLNRHCDNPWNRTLATMSSVYFPDIWRGTATVVGLIILGFTFWNFLRPYVS